MGDGEGGQVFLGVQGHLPDLGELLPEHVGHRVELVMDGFGGGLDEDGADGRRDHFPGSLGYHGEHISQEMDTTTLTGGAEHDLADRGQQAAVAVGDDQADPAQPALAQGPQELAPERLGLAVTDHHTQHLTA
ncbi:hypothetical protein SSP24_83370 [Streptomyces spinoverrucosus]|uniref:Uncharacterized protein n=1 Tax=Streptomyces spinoverrucosus TaxID=284043 RepID=A0A4Y3VUN4_9ACTN|nr:hypothetical protein SSP24_83370 [Streptomyces spinoverrucosus]GHB99543.1 hypothetical protein GCM10010397_84640 [Streptomyces spinoverrucosus]